MLSAIGNIVSNLGMGNLTLGKLGNEWWRRISDAPPATRNVDVCSIPVYRKRGEREDQAEYLGHFAPERFVVANAPCGTLEWQMQEKEWARGRPDLPKNRLSLEYREALAHERPDLFEKLYRPDWSRKTPFELSLIPGQTFVTECMEEEYRFRQDNDLPLPAMISKFRVVPDYLAHLPLVRNEKRDLPQWVIKLLDFADSMMTWPNNKAAIPLEEVPEGGLFLKSPVGQGVKLNIENRSDKTTTLEKILHYVSLWAAPSAAIIGSIEWALGASNPFLLLSVVGATYLASKCGKDFGFFDLVEEIYRARFIFNKDLTLGKFSLSGTVETSVYLAALGFAAYFATAGAWTSALALPWESLSSIVGPGILSALKTGTAGFLATTAGLAATFVGSVPIRFFWRFSFFDNRIDFDAPQMQEMQRKAETINPARQRMTACLEKMERDAQCLSPAERVEYERKFRNFLIRFRDVDNDGRDQPEHGFDVGPRRLPPRRLIGGPPRQ